MANLFNIGINQIRHSNKEVILMKLNGMIIYEKDMNYPLYFPSEFQYKSDLVSVNVMVNETHDNLERMFAGCTSLVSIGGIKRWNTSNVTTMNRMFYNCQSLTTLNLSSFNTSNVTNMSNMFYYCHNLKSLDVSNFDTSKVTAMDWMFYHCNSLTTLDLSSFDVINVTNMLYMLGDCFSLVDFQAPKNINCNFNVSDSPLSRDSLVSIVNNLVPTESTKTLTLGYNNASKLTTEEKMDVINKGWTIAS